MLAFRKFMTYVRQLPSYPNPDKLLEAMGDFLGNIKPKFMPVFSGLAVERHGTSTAEKIHDFYEQATPQDRDDLNIFLTDNRKVTSTIDLIPITEVKDRFELATIIQKQTATASRCRDPNVFIPPG
jgi:hypothetical protein